MVSKISILLTGLYPQTLKYKVNCEWIVEATRDQIQHFIESSYNRSVQWRTLLAQVYNDFHLGLDIWVRPYRSHLHRARLGLLHMGAWLTAKPCFMY